MLWLSVVTIFVCAVVALSTPAPDAKWLSVDSDSEGRVILAVALEAVYYSTDSGVNWKKAKIGCWSFSRGAVSADGKYMIVGTNCMQTVSSTDFGASWTGIALPKDFAAANVAVSSTGEYMVAASILPSTVGQVQVSSDFGNTWLTSDTKVDTLGSLAMSSIGDHIFLGPLSGSFQHSLDYGKSFDHSTFSTVTGGVLGCDSTCGHMAYNNYMSLMVSNNNGTDFSAADIPFGLITDVAFSADGKYIFTSLSGTGIYASSDFGAKWQRTSAPMALWSSITTADSGKIVVATVAGGMIYVSNDYGNTWA
jgi:photosystem II stability/assembly factor-like uncharacterized protein